MTISLPPINMGSPDILIFLVTGLIAGILASLAVGGRRNMILIDMVLGVIGAFLGRWLFGIWGINLGTGVVPEIVVAFVGAFILLLVVRAVSGGVGHRPAS